MFTIGESRTISHPNDTELQAQQAYKSSPRKIFHWNSSGERRLKFIGQRIEEDNREAENIALAQRKQRRQHSDHKRVQIKAATKYYSYIVNETDDCGEGTPTADDYKSDETGSGNA